ncbi:MAG TPA: cytochrome P450 [Rhodothermales bacterium]|nr:cytochrome P450 [Rhodothermales bacterium]
MEPAAPAYSVRPFPRRYPGELLRVFARNMVEGMGRLDRVGGDAVGARLGPARVTLLRHPDLLRALLTEHDASFSKARGLRMAKHLLGDGLLTSEPPFHTRQRRLILPAFHHQRLRGYADDMVAESAAEATRWVPGAPFDAARAMNRLALSIAGRTLFGADVAADTDRIGRAMAESMGLFDRAMSNPLGELLARLPTPSRRRLDRARETLDATVYGLIRDRRASGEDRPDLLGMLLDAHDEDGSVMTDRQVRDEAMTLLLAGHETTANALAWTWALLAEHPEVEARLHAELDGVLNGRPPAFEDVPRLAYTRQVFAESMRLYPPAWVVARQAREDVDLGGGVRFPRGGVAFFAPLFIHRDERFWDAPDEFRPERFAADVKRERHKFAYLPFSAGRRGCIGEQFAWMEGVLVLATLAQRWRLRLTAPVPAPHGSITLRPAGPLLMRAEPRVPAELSTPGGGDTGSSHPVADLASAPATALR